MDFIVLIAICIFWGVICQMIAKNKGYEGKGFWSGFLFGIFALIYWLAKSENQQ